MIAGLKEANMIPTAWKFEETSDGIVYSIQFNEVPWKYKKALQEAMKDWSRSSHGWHKDSGNQIFIFKKTFKTAEDWDRWAESFPIQITEKRYWGNKEKTILHGKKGKT